jgi:hypothetical protein
MLEYCISFVSEKRDKFAYRKIRRRDEERDVENADEGTTFSRGNLDFVGLGKASLGALRGALKGMLWREHSEHEGEKRTLLGGHGTAGRYGYHEGLFYRDQERMVDGTSESVSTGHTTTIVHRDDCEGQCGLKSRRQSGEV